MTNLFKPVLLVVLTLCFSACQENDVLQPADEQRLIDQAKAYFENNVVNANVPVNQDNPRATLSRDVVWGEASLRELPEGQKAVAVPLRFANGARLNSDVTGNEVLLSDYAELLLQHDNTRNWHAEVITHMPLTGYSGKKGESFAGFVFVEDWHGNALKQWQHTPEGKMHSLNLVPNAAPVARDAETVCITQHLTVVMPGPFGIETYTYPITVCWVVGGPV